MKKAITVLLLISFLFSCQWKNKKKELYFFVGKWKSENTNPELGIVLNQNGTGKFILYVPHNDTLDSCTTSISWEWFGRREPQEEKRGRKAELAMTRYDNVACSGEF